MGEPIRFLRLKRGGAPKASPYEDEIRLYADDGSALRTILHDGTDEPVAGAGSLPNPTDEGDVLTVSSGVWAGEPPSGGSMPVTVQEGPPTQATNADFNIAAVTPVASGTYTLTFESVTTDPIDGTTGTGDDIAAAMNAAYGDTIARAYPGDYGALTPNDGTYVQFIGALGAQDIATPTVTDDTTDGGIATADDTTGAPADPPGANGDLLVDVTNLELPVAYQYGPAANPTGQPENLQGGASTAVVWHRVWAPNELLSTSAIDDWASVLVAQSRLEATLQTPSGAGPNVMELLLGSGSALLRTTNPDNPDGGVSQVNVQFTSIEISKVTLESVLAASIVLASDGIRMDGLGLFLVNLPTAPPAGDNQVWNDGGTLKITPPPGP